MRYSDEYLVELGTGFDPDGRSSARLAALFENAERITAFESTRDHHFTQDLRRVGVDGSLCYRINTDCLIEINDVYLSQPVAIKNEVADLISFQFVSAVRRSEYLGERRNVHDLGPALLVTAIPEKETTYRMPSAGVHIQHAVVYTTLSNLMDRLGEEPGDYPSWLNDILAGRHKRPRQRVFFLEDVHRYSLSSCFHRPVSGKLVGHWMAAKFDELLCIGLQILKNSKGMRASEPVDLDLPYSDKIRRAKAILEKEYAHPPNLTELARRLGISETRLKSGFKLMIGSTVMQYCIERRIEAARYLLKANRHSIAEIGDIVGYEDPSAFARAFRRHCGTTPREWQQNNRV